MYVATAEGQSSMLTVSAGVPQGAVWLPLLFNLCIRFLPSVVQFSSVIGYTDDHTLLKIIPLKQDHLRATDELNTNLAALFQFGRQWFMDFAPLKTKTLFISLKRDTFDHPALFMNDCLIAEVSSLKILGFMFDSSITWGPHMDMIFSKTKQRLAQLSRLSSYLDSVGLSIMYKSFVRSCLEYGHLLYFGAVRGYLKHLDALQCQAASVCHSTSPSLESRQRAAAIGFLCRLLDVVIYSHFSLTLLQLFLEDPLALIICQILPQHLHCKTLSHSGVWIVTAEVSMV